MRERQIEPQGGSRPDLARDLSRAERSLRRLFALACGLAALLAMLIIAQMLKWSPAERAIVVAYSALLLWCVVVIAYAVYSLLRFGHAVEEGLVRQSLMDGLTGAFNHRYLHMRLAEECERVRRYGGNAAVLFLDLDEFKQVNDRFGHQVGDEVLRVLAAEMRKKLRVTDIFGRMGGDEFMAIFPETNAEQAGVLTERMLELVRTFRMEAGKEGVVDFVRFSGGLAVHPTNGQSARALVKAADDAMYQAKQAGGDRVVVSTESVAAED